MLLTNQTIQDYWFGPLHLLGGVGQTLTVDDTTSTSLYLGDDGVADAINTLYAAGNITVSSAAAPFPRPTGDPTIYHGDGSPEGLVYAGQGSIYLRRDSATIYQKTTGIHLNTNWAAAITTNPRVTTSLFSAGPPASPVDGDEWIALAVDTGNLSTTNGTVWRFRYNASSGSSYKWEFLGGPPLVSGMSGNLTTSSTTMVALTSGPSITTTRGGDYACEIACLAQNNAASNNAVAINLANVGGTIFTNWSLPATSGFLAKSAAQGLAAALAASTVLTLQAKTSSGVSTIFTEGFIKITPVRIS
jgi:hypothetical protein